MLTDLVPLFVSVGDMHVTVFGGGPVALRKCKHFEGADITVVALEVIPGIKEAVSEIVISKAEDAMYLISRSDIVVAATSDKELNDKIKDAALLRGKHVNSAHGGGDILIPSVLKRKGYAVAVSSLGTVPAFPPYVVEELEAFLGEKFDLMFDVISLIRDECRNMWTQPMRSKFLRNVLHDPSVLSYVNEGKKGLAIERAKRMMEGAE